MKYQPYTYFLKHKTTGMKYYGVRYKIGCNPSDFFTTYFTSSKIIHNIIEQHGTKIFECKIHKIFDTAEEACDFEYKILKKLGACTKNDWYNMSLSGGIPVLYSKGCVPWNKGLQNKTALGRKFYNNGEQQKMFHEGDVPDGWVSGRLNKPWNKGLDITDDRVATNIKKATKTRKSGNYVPWNKGKTKFDDDRLRKQSEYVKSTVTQVCCPHCGIEGGSTAMKRHHFNNCKKK